jgi:hypothetical protein
MFSAARRLIQQGSRTAATSGSRLAQLHPSGVGALRQQYRSVFIQTLDTPNPESLKFIPSGVPVLESNGEDLNGYYVTKNDPINEILRSPLAKRLFDVEGVKAVYLGSDFVTGEHRCGLWKWGDVPDAVTLAAVVVDCWQPPR